MVARIIKILLITLWAQCLLATTYTFNGNAGDDMWSNPDNWDVYPGLSIQAGDMVILDSNNPCIIEVDETLTNHGTILAQNNSAYSSLIIQGSFTNHGNIDFQNGTSLEINAQVESYGDINVSGTLEGWGSLAIFEGLIDINTNYSTIDLFYLGEFTCSNNEHSINVYSAIMVDVWDNNGVIFASSSVYVGDNDDGHIIYNSDYSVDYSMVSGYVSYTGNTHSFTDITNTGTVNIVDVNIGHGFTNSSTGILYIASEDCIHYLQNCFYEPAYMYREIAFFSNKYFIQADGGKLFMDIRDDQTNDIISVQDTAFLDGTLSLNLLDGYIPDGCSEWEIITADSVSGEFSIVNFPTVGMGNWSVVYEPQSVIIRFAPTAENNAINFDGIDDYIDVPHNIGLAQTIEFMFNPAVVNPTANGQVVMSFNNSSDQFVGYLDMLPGVTGETLVIQNGTGNAIYTDYPFGNDWYHIAIKPKSGVYRQIFVNGVAIATNALNHPPLFSINSMQISGANNSNYFEGSLDELRLWNVDRTESEIYAHYDAVIDPSNSNLLAVYQFDHGVVGEDNNCANICDDGTSNMHHGTLVNFGLSGTNSNWVSNDCPADMRTNTFLPASGEWSIASNWSAGQVPGPCHIVVIPANAVVNIAANATVSCYALNIENGATINVPSNSTLIIYGD